MATGNVDGGGELLPVLWTCQKAAVDMSGVGQCMDRGGVVARQREADKNFNTS